MNNNKKVYVKITNLNRYSYIEKQFNCDGCRHADMCADMSKCPIIAAVAHDVSRTTYNIDGASLRIDTATFGRDCRRALNVVNMAIDSCRRQR